MTTKSRRRELLEALLQAQGELREARAAETEAVEWVRIARQHCQQAEVKYEAAVKADLDYRIHEEEAHEDEGD